MNTSNSFKNTVNLTFENKLSIYDHISNNLNEDGKLNLKGYKLPDDHFVNKNDTSNDFYTNLETIIKSRISNKENDIQLANYIKKISLNSTAEDKIKFYEIAINSNISYIIDNIYREIKRLNIKINKNLYDWIEFLTFKSPHREAVKLGVSLIGIFHMDVFKEKIKILATHDEFSLIVFKSLSFMNIDFETELFELAKKVDGWGRIQLVELLSKTNNKNIKHWILTKGYKNNIMYDYLALLAANCGDLNKELSKDVVDKEILIAARDIIEALILETNLVGISVYPYAAKTIELFIKNTINDSAIYGYRIYKYIYKYITDEKKDWDFYKENGWTNENRKKIARTLEKYQLIS